MRDALIGVKAYFDSQLSTAISTIQTATGATIETLKYMDRYPCRSRQYPFMEILPDEGENSYSYEDTPIEQGWKYRNVDLIVVHNSSDLESVIDTLLLYELVINELVETDNSFGSRFNRVRIIDFDWSDVGQYADTKQFEQALKITLEIRKVLSY